MTVKPWPDRTYEHLCTLIAVTKGALCDSDFDMELHSRVVKVWTSNRGDDIVEAAMMMSCLGHRITSEMEDRIHFLEKSKNLTKESKEIINEQLS